MPEDSPAEPDFAMICVDAIYLARTDAIARKDDFTKRHVVSIVREQFALWRDRGGQRDGATPAERIYAAYPRHVGRKSAVKAITAALGARSYEVLLGRVDAFAEAVKRWPASERKFIPHPATWFNRGSYDDDAKEWERGATRNRPDDTTNGYTHF